MTRTSRWPAALAAVAGLALAGWSCASGPEVSARREFPAIWRDAGRALPTGAARTRYLELAERAVAEAEALRDAEASAFRGLVTAGERHDVSRGELYAPFDELAEQRKERLMAYARHRMAMREALTADEWGAVLQAVKR